jgi:hypothetical protein
MSRIIWYIKQLFPLWYKTQYAIGAEKHFVVWQMWLGKCFNISDVKLAG